MTRAQRSAVTECSVPAAVAASAERASQVLRWAILPPPLSPPPPPTAFRKSVKHSGKSDMETSSSNPYRNYISPFVTSLLTREVAVADNSLAGGSDGIDISSG